MTRTVRTAFTAATVLLLLGGGVVVGAQLVALVLGRGEWLAPVEEAVGPPTFVAASVAGLLAFVLSYRDGATPAREEPTAPSDPA